MFNFLNSWLIKINQRLTRKGRNRKWLMLAYTLRKTAGYLSVFYLPLFLYEVAQEIDIAHASFTPVQKGMVVISIFYLCERLTSAIVGMIQAHFTLKLGHQMMMVVSSFVYSLFLLSLSYVEQYPLLFLCSAILSGLELALFWQSYNTLFGRWSVKAHMGRSLSLIRFAKNFSAMVTPAIGGIIISFLGYNYLFYAGIGLMLLSLAAVFNLEVAQEKDKVNLEEYWSWMKEKTFNRLLIAQVGRYFNDISLTLWPLYVFLLIGSIEKVGYIYSLSMFLVLLTTLFAGKFLDNKNKSKTPFFISGSFLSSLWLIKLTVVNAWGVVIVDAIDRLVGNFHWLFHERTIFNRGKGSQDFSYFVYRSVNRSIAAVIFWTLLLAFFLLIPVGWTGLFVLAAVGVLLSLLVEENKNSS